MNTRRLLLALSALLLVFIVLGVGAVGATLWLSAQAQAGRGQLLVLDHTRLALLPSRGDLRILSEETTSEGFLYPVPSPDGTQVAFVTSGADGTHLFALSLQSGERKELFSVPQPLQLFYMNWSPDSRTISFLTPAGMSGLGVFVVPADGSAQAQIVSGAHSTAFFAWTPDSRSLLLHLDGSVFEQGQIATFTLGSKEPSVINADLGLFQAPAWSNDGAHVFYVTQPKIAAAQPTVDDIDSVLTRAAPNGSDATELVHEKSAALFFTRAPDSDQIAYTSLLLQEKQYGPLTLVDGQTGARRTLSRETDHVVAFFWSPDGDQIAYLTRETDSDPTSSYTWHLVTINGGTIRDLSSFRPTASFIGLISFFDAYAHAFTLWSADSRLLTYATSEGVYTLDAKTGTTARVAAGELGMWVRPIIDDR